MIYWIFRNRQFLANSCIILAVMSAGIFDRGHHVLAMILAGLVLVIGGLLMRADYVYDREDE